MTDEALIALQQLVEQLGYIKDYAVLITIFFGLIVGLLCVLIVKKGV